MRYYIDRQPFEDDPKQKLGGGSEGSVYIFPPDPDFCVKLFHKPDPHDPDGPKLAAFRKRKINYICHSTFNFPPHFIMALKAAYSERHQVIGFLMRRVPSGFYKMMQLLKEDFRLANDINLGKISLLFADVFDDVPIIHGSQVVMGDINTGSILISADLTRRAFVDTDSWGYSPEYPCLATTELFAHPDLYPNLVSGGKFILHQPHHDRFSFTVMFVLMALSGAHPFRMGLHPRFRSLQERTKNGSTIFDSDVSYPDILPPPELLSDDLMDAVVKILKRKTIDPLDTGLLRRFSAELVICPNCGAQYHESRKSCPKCHEKTMIEIKVAQLLVEEIFKTGGTLLFAQVVQEKLHLVCRVDDKLQVVVIDQHKHVSVISSALAAEPGARYRFFTDCLVKCSDPAAAAPVKLEMYQIKNNSLIFTDETNTVSFRSQTAMFDTSSRFLYRIAGNMLMRGSFFGKMFLENPVTEVFSTQTWFTVDRTSGADQEIIFGYDGALRDLRWFLLVGDEEKTINYHVALPATRSGEKLEDFSVYFNKTNVLLIRKTKYRGKDFIRFSLIDLTGQIQQDILLNDSEEGFAYWQELQGKLFQSASVLHLSTEGLVKHELISQRYSPVAGTKGLIMADDRLLRFNNKIIVVRRNSIFSLSPKK
ncbi:MAG: hypothetical protein PHT40_01430 [Patescibacteria group bacterium]|nr:hypothetical protein [Patescibacteria group bacterium]